MPLPNLRATADGSRVASFVAASVNIMRAVLRAVVAFAHEQLWLRLQREAAANGAFLYGDDVHDAPVRVALKCIQQEAPSQSVSSADKSIGCSSSSRSGSSVCSANAIRAKKKCKQQRQQRRAHSKLALSPRAATALCTRVDAPTAGNGASQVCPVRDVPSDASTCGSSDEDDDRDDDESEDLGERERRLMLERAQHIKNVTMQQSRRARRKSALAAAPSAAAATEAGPRAPSRLLSKRDRATHSVAREMYAPVRLRNVANTLWSWSVFSGFEADQRPLDARFVGHIGDGGSSDDKEWLRMCADLESHVRCFLDDEEYQ